ncbi:type II toxin-antitoxin system Phd/YefM family antitoxin [Tolypothrix sp. PCC 7910]|uniref:type II toxin-antitoxin system Phd/YefM family antitoxin n=1 Tax=Tolypothrix sp. PCC 7910 TaxID=2099387 RepID=UPI00142797A2|nr:type II toxin-antitoxin system prevent-host-death family antitoxin [Tolypothrix sp. PCC 7910]QIR38212.1 type II toxin-antitoxin system Phd/YefM family antitoxin [Tolypothrix sp. PCC 7910]
MKTIDITQALAEISELIAKAVDGEEIIITKNNQPIVKLVGLQPLPQRPPLFSSDYGLISITDDFDEPLEEFFNLLQLK